MGVQVSRKGPSCPFGFGVTSARLSFSTLATCRGAAVLGKIRGRNLLLGLRAFGVGKNPTGVLRGLLAAQSCKETTSKAAFSVLILTPRWRIKPIFLAT
jgi:hypothetical protein